MAVKWQKTKFPGVRYREHASRKHGLKKDRYFSIYFRLDRKTKEEGLGWGSQGWTEQKAVEALAELKHNQRTGEGPQTLEEKRRIEHERRLAEEITRQKEVRENFTFGQLAEKYLEWAKGNKKSWRDDVHRYELHLRPLLGKKPLKEITPFLLEQLKRNLQRQKRTFRNSSRRNEENGLAPATVKHCLVLVRQMFNKANIWEIYDGLNPVRKIKLPSTANNQRHRFLAFEEADSLLNELAGVSPQLHDQCLLALHCGLRFGEIVKLTLADMDFNHDIIQIRDPKGHSRQAFMTDEVKEMLLDRKPERPVDLVFPSRRGGLQVSVSNSFDRAVQRLGFNDGLVDRRDKVVFHTLRHTFASWLAIQGTPILTIKELMGHKSIEMTMRYAHLVPDQKQKAIQEMVEGFRCARENSSKVVIADQLR